MKAPRTEPPGPAVHGLVHPSRDCSQAPFWFWNGPLDPDVLAGQIREMADKGVHAAMPHPRFGMDRRDYLGPAYWKAFSAVVKQAEALGSQVMLYDEYNWPSGGAGGRVTDGHPELYPHALDYVVRDVEGKVRLGVADLVASEPESSSTQSIVAAFLVPSDCPVQLSELPVGGSGDSELEVRPWGRLATDGASVAGQVPPGRHRLLVFILTRTSNPSPLDSGSGSFVDFMNPQTAKRFIALTHDQYARRYARHFGKTIPCIFTDEPQAMASGPFPWTGDLLREFQRRRGYDLRPHFVALVDDRYPRGWQHRAAYWQTVSELIDERFFEPIARWCRRHGIALTGHVFDELIGTWPTAPHLMNWLRRFDWPGIDALGPRVKITGAKIAASVAHLEEKPHFLCEALGLARGWNATLGMTKRGYNFLALMGVDILVPHAFFQTVENSRVECPPSFFLQNPYWKYYGSLAGMTDRLCAFNRLGRHVAPVAVYYPIESLWADGTGGKGQNVKPWECKNRGNVWASRTISAFDTALTACSAGEWDCDVVDAAALVKARVQADGGLKIGPEVFSCLVLPAMRTLATSAAERIQEFVRAGGTLVATGSLPCRSYPATGDASLDLRAAFAIPESAGTGEWAVGRGRVIVLANEADLRATLASRIAPNVRFVGGRNEQVYVAVRRNDEATAWLVVNDGSEPCAVELELPPHLLPEGCARLTAVDPVTGVCRPLPCRITANGLQVTCRLEHTQAMMLVAEAALHPEISCPGAGDALPAKALALDRWTLQLVPRLLDEKWAAAAKPALVELPVWKATGRDWRRLEGWTRPEFNDSEWKTVATQRGGALLDDEVVLFRTHLPPGAMALRMPLPVSGEYMLHVNGKLVEKRLGPAPKRGTLDLSKWVNGIGDVIALEVSSLSGASGLSAPVDVLCGPVELPRLMDWQQLRAGWYSGRALYRTQVALPRAVKGPVWLDLGRVEHYAEVWVNGKLATTLLWAPYRVEISRHLRPGRNSLVVVVSNSLSNRFAWDTWGTRCGRSWGVTPKPDPSGLLGPVRLLKV